MSTNTMNTWRVSHPINHDATYIHIIRYEWPDTEEEEQGQVHHNYILSLEPDPHWVEYGDLDMIQPTLIISGLDLTRMGVRKMPPTFDLRNETETKINDMIVEALTPIMDIRLPVEFTDASS